MTKTYSLAYLTTCYDVILWKHQGFAARNFLTGSYLVNFLPHKKLIFSYCLGDLRQFNLN